jgi:hypothetical protein
MKQTRPPQRRVPGKREPGTTDSKRVARLRPFRLVPTDIHPRAVIRADSRPLPAFPPRPLTRRAVGSDRLGRSGRVRPEHPDPPPPAAAALRKRPRLIEPEPDRLRAPLAEVAVLAAPRKERQDRGLAPPLRRAA